ncbi:hypothetical protein ABT351_27660, partial [Micromonospora sp. NPDC000018]
MTGAGGPAPAPAGAAGGGHGIVDVADAGAFLARLVRLDRDAPVRLRPTGAAGRTALWGHLPWGVLAVRTVAGDGPGDVTVAAGELLAELAAGGGGGGPPPPARGGRGGGGAEEGEG